MKSFTGKFSSVRGWALLPALLLGAGMMISACGDEEVPAPTTPTPPPTPPPAPEPTPEPTGPATPENLRVSASTSNSITWMWDAVEGALGYQGQFSTDATFADADPTFIVVAPNTSHTVSNLSGNMTGHFRVRSGTGTSLTDLTYSEWTDGVSGSTAAPAPATAFAAPGSFTAESATDDSISLSWDEVDDAASYEVDQRLAGGTWGDTDCGGTGSNEVDGTSCVAEGLDEGTDYEFRVRALPASDDTTNAIGEWAETDGTTTGSQAVTTPGGMGDLDVTWTADGDSITFTWSPMAGSEYEWAPATGDIEDANPCGGATFNDLTVTNAGTGAQFEVDVPAANEGTIIGLCVRTTDKDNRALSFAWGIRRPDPATATQTEATVSDGDVTTALTWTDLDIKTPFEYEIRVAADPRRNNDLVVAGTPTAAQVRAVQAACGDGAFVDQGDTDVDFTLDEITVSSGLTPYTGYVLCARMANTTGATEWAVPAAKLLTTPGKPPTPTIDPSRTEVVDANESVVWRIANRNMATVPRTATTGGAANYVAWRVHYNATYRVTGATSNRSTPAPRLADCETRGTDPNDDSDHTGDDWTWTEIVAASMSTDNNGIALASGTIPRNPPLADPANTDTTGDTRAAVCVRAVDSGLNGPWVMSGTHTVRRQPRP